jgi:hypothetical protein
MEFRIFSYCTNHLTNLPNTSSKAAKLLKIYHRFA